MKMRYLYEKGKDRQLAVTWQQTGHVTAVVKSCEVPSAKEMIIFQLLQRTQGPEEMCLSLEHQNQSKTSEKMGYLDRVTVSLHILQTASQETEGSQDRPTAFGHPSGDVPYASEDMACG